MAKNKKDLGVKDLPKGIKKTKKLIVLEVKT